MPARAIITTFHTRKFTYIIGFVPMTAVSSPDDGVRRDSRRWGYLIPAGAVSSRRVSDSVSQH